MHIFECQSSRYAIFYLVCNKNNQFKYNYELVIYKNFSLYNHLGRLPHVLVLVAPLVGSQMTKQLKALSFGIPMNQIYL